MKNISLVREIHAALIITLICAVMPGCGDSRHAEYTGEVKTVAVAELLMESNSFSPVLSTRKDFEAESLLYGDDIPGYSREEKKELAGFLKAVDEHGNGKIRVVPILKARAMSGGPLERGLYEKFRKTIIDGLKAVDGLDGIYLSLHGAMGVEGMHDPEGDLLEGIREAVGDSIPIGTSYDLHAVITEKKVKNSTFIVGYHTNPHRDHLETGYSTGRILIDTVQGRVNPVMEWNKMKLLKGGGMNIDLLSPMRKIFRRMKKMEKMDGVLNVSNFMVHIWIDDPELGWSTVAVTDGKKDLARELADELADMDWAVRDVKHPEGNTPEEAVEIARGATLARKLGTVVFCDASDAVGTGTPGESTWILKALMEKGADMTSYLTIRDGKAAREAYSKKIGDELSLFVGGRLDRVYNRPVRYSGSLVYREDGRLGKRVILKHEGIHLVISELPDASMYPSDYTDLGLGLWKADIVVVKNLFPFRYRYLLYNRKTVNVFTPGLSNTDVFELKYRNIPRPIYPLDNIDSWK